MKRRLNLLAVGAMLATLGVFAPSPANANFNDVCSGQGVANLSTGFGYPGLVPKNTANFAFHVSLAACLTKVSLSASGTVNGWCSLSTGAGTTDNGHRFVFQSSGMTMTLTGEVVGTAHVTPDPTHTGSCTNKTATRFIVTFEINKVECAGDSENAAGTFTTNKDTNTSAMTCQPDPTS